MSRALLAFNPEAYGSGGDRLLFGVAAPTVARPSRLSALEELNLATRFLEAQPGVETVALLRSVIQRSGTSRDRTIDPQVVEPLLNRLARSAAIVRNALRSSEAATGSPVSPEAIFGTELEGLSPEDRELETALRFVRMASEMTRIAKNRYSTNLRSAGLAIARYASGPNDIHVLKSFHFSQQSN